MSSWQKIVSLWTCDSIVWPLDIVFALYKCHTICTIVPWGTRYSQNRRQIQHQLQLLMEHRQPPWVWNIWIVSKQSKYDILKHPWCFKKTKEAWTPIIAPVVNKIINKSTVGGTRSKACQLSLWQPSGKFNFPERPIIVFNLGQSISQIRKHWSHY